MDYISALYYGIIQGLTEFLPVSSSAHLALLPKFLKINDPGITFDLAMHLGTAFAIIIYFRTEVILILKECFTLSSKGHQKNSRSYYTLNLLISTIVTFILVMVGKKLAFEYGRSTNIIAMNLLVFGILMWIFDSKGTRSQTNYMFSTVDLKKASLIGLFQSLAIFPGVSRSGATLTISRALGLSREEATRFSFLLSLPIIIGGLVFKLPDFLNGDLEFDISICIFGIFISFVVGIMTIHFFLIFIKRIGLWVFSIYRIIFALLLIFLLN